MTAITTVKWEYKVFSLTWQAGESGWVSADYYTEPAAKMHYWLELQQSIMPSLQKLFDEGWQPITDIGSGAVQVRYFKDYDNPTAGIILNIIGFLLSLTILLIPLAFLIVPQKYPKYELLGYKVELRRQLSTPARPITTKPTTTELLRNLTELRDRGVLTPGEFEDKKRKLLKRA